MDLPLSLCWNDYLKEITDAFGSLRDEEGLVDVTLSCEGKTIKAHKILLSACSPYFRDVFKENPCQHPVVVFQNVKFTNLKAVVDFIYCGKVNVLHEDLESFLSTAELLMVKGLSDKDNESQVVETSGITKDNSDVVFERRGTRSTGSKNKTSLSTSISRPSTPPAKRRRSDTENPESKSPVISEVKGTVEFSDVSVSSEEAIVVKEEVDFFDVEDNDVKEEGDFSVTEPEVDKLFKKLFVPEKSKPRPKRSKKKSAAELPITSQDTGYHKTRRPRGWASMPDTPLRLTQRHFLEPIPPTANKDRPRRKCHVCTNTTKRTKRRRDTRFMCLPCNVPLCIEPCMKDYHTYKNY